jgi:hypothetical protein
MGIWEIVGLIIVGVMGLCGLAMLLGLTILLWRGVLGK